MFDKITWPVVALVTVALAALVVMTVLHAPTGEIANLLILLGIGGVVGVGSGIRANVNGNLSRTLDVIHTALLKLAEAPATPPDKGDDNGSASGPPSADRPA